MTATVGNFQDGANQLFNQGLFEESATKKHKLGTIRTLSDGRRFVYVGNTAAALTAGACISKVQAPQACTVAAADAAINVVGAKKITFTLTGTPTAGLYEDGFCVLTSGTGIGQIYKIRGNTADDDPATGRCTFYLYDGLATAHLAADTTATVYQSPHKDLLVNPAVADGAATTQETIIGVTQRAVTASMYFWAQTWGMASLVLDIDAAAGGEANEMWIISGSTAGRGRVVEDTAISGTQVLGTTFVSTDATDAQACLVNLLIS